MSKFYFYKSQYIEFVIVKEKILAFSEHCHSSDYVITVITDGMAKLKRENVTQLLYKNDCFSIDTYENHTLFSDTPVSMISMCIKKSMILSYNYQQYSDCIENSLRSADRYIDLKYVELLRETAYQLYEDYHYYDYDKNNSIFASIEDIVVMPETEKSVEQLASENYISKYHFIRKFRKISGLTPHKFQIQSRIRKAQQLLIDGYNITETAQLVGFYDQSHFDKYFKMIVGISPKEYISSLSNFLQV